MGIINQNDYIGVLKSEIQEIQWEVDDVLKSKENAAVVLSFNYEDKLIGTSHALHDDFGNVLLEDSYDKLGTQQLITRYEYIGSDGSISSAIN